jgi:two-component system sensor kinase FixL
MWLHTARVIVESELGRKGHLHTQLVYELTSAVSQAHDVEQIFEAALSCLGESVGTERSSILLFGEDGRMHFRAWRNLSSEYRQAVDGHSPWDPGTTDAKPVLVPDVLDDPAWAEFLPVFEAENIRSLAFIPLMAGSRLIGKFMVYYAEPHEFDTIELMASQTIAAQVAFAVEHEAARAAHDRLSTLNQRMIDSIGIAVYATDRDGYITQFNEEAVELWQRRPVLGEEMWCGSWRIFTPEGEPVAHRDCPMGVALRENRPIRGVEIVVENPDGSRHTVLPHPTPLHDADGNLIGAVNALVDITEQSRMRRELQETLVAKDDFLGQVSHELRTPLTQLMGNGHLLARRWDTLDEETKKESVYEIVTHSQRMQRLVNNMLVLSRLERGMIPEAEPQLIQRLLQGTLNEFSARFPDAELRCDILPELPPVATNPDTIDQVLWNLLTNAKKYGPSRGPITVCARSTDGWAEVTVTDCGPGVAVEEMDRLFEPYFRSSATATHAAGLGLGLSVCKTLIEAQGGKIWARRIEPRGMEFGFGLPALADREG